jgi:hypothetical protein
MHGGFLIERFSNTIQIIFAKNAHPLHTHLKRHHPGVTITVAGEKKKICANPAQDTISTTPVWEFRNANAITKFIGVFIAADLRPFSVVDKQAVFFFSLNYEP